MRYEGVRYYPRRSLNNQINKLHRRMQKYFVGWDSEHEPIYSCKGRIAHIRRQIVRIHWLVQRSTQEAH